MRIPLPGGRKMEFIKIIKGMFLSNLNVDTLMDSSYIQELNFLQTLILK